MDTTLGPIVDSHVRTLDFTLLFEESFLKLVPWTLFFLLLPIRLRQLSGKSRKVEAGSLYLFKGALWTIHTALQLAQLILWTRLATFKTPSTIPSAAIALVGTMAATMLSHFEHYRSKRPSTILCLFVLLIFLCDMTRTRTTWLMGQPLAVSILSTAMLPILLLVLVLESRSKVNLCESNTMSSEEVVGIFSRSLFWWLNPLFFFGRNHELQQENLPPIDTRLLSSNASPQLRERCNLKSQGSGSLLVASLRAYHTSVLTGAIWRLVMALFTMSQPLLLNRTTRWFDNRPGPVPNALGYGLIGAYVIVYGGRAISTALGEHQNYRLITLTRAGLVSLVYNKTLDLRLAEAERSASLTLMSTDIERIAQGLQFLHEIWATPIEFGVAIFLLDRQVGLGSLAPIFVVTMSVVGTTMLGMKIGPHQKTWLEAIQGRISSTTGILRSMRSIKMSGLEDVVVGILQAMRVAEVSVSRSTKVLFIACQVLSTTTTTLSPVLGFLIYARIQQAKGEAGLASSNAFTSLSLFNILATSVNIFITAVPAIFSGIGCFERIQAFLSSTGSSIILPLEGGSSLPSTLSREEASQEISPKEMSSSTNITIVPDSMVSFEEGTVQWAGTDKQQLSRINLTVPEGAFYHVTGPTGSGKSSLLNHRGCRTSPSKNVFSLDKNAIRDSKTQPFLCVPLRRTYRNYQKVTKQEWATEEQVLAVARGTGWQVTPSICRDVRANIILQALARAVYARRRLVLLDDTFSGLDHNTAQLISQRLFSSRGLFRQLGATVIYSGFSEPFNRYADYVLLLDDIGHGCHVEAATKYAKEFQEILADPGRDQQPMKEENSEYNAEPGAHSTTIRPEKMPKTKQVSTFSMMVFYLRSSGLGLAVVVFMLSLTYSFFLNFSTVWVNIWIQEDMKHPYQEFGLYLGVYALYAILALTANTAATWVSMISMVRRSAEGLHQILLNTVAGAPMSYFDNTDIGIITNHFSQDIEKIDIEIPLTGIQSLFAFTSAIVQSIILAVAARYIAIAFPVVIAVVVSIQRVYLRTSRQLRLLDLGAKSPLYSHFTQTLSGLATIRAFRLQDQCQSINSKWLDYSQRPFYLLFCAQRWLTLVLNLVVGAMAVLTMGIAIKLRGIAGAGDIGLAFVSLTTFSQSIQSLVTWWTVMETSIGAVHRVAKFKSETVQEDGDREVMLPPNSWPATGAIEMRAVTAVYGSSTIPAVMDISFSISHGQKVGICGRTGSGKTSLILCLLRMLDVTSGSIWIDGLDICQLSANSIRQRLITIPQDSFTLKGTVRRNLDPFSIHSDENLRDSLSRVGLWDLIDSKGGLDTTMHEGLLSHGQRQLFSLASALLKKSPVVILDEITSSVDEASQTLIQQICSTDFQNRTVITIAHKLEPMGRYDHIIVLGGGKLVEQGNPRDLLDRTDSIFRELYLQELTSKET